MEHFTTSIFIEPEIWKQFKVLNIHRQEKIGESLGRLVSAEVKKNLKLIKGESA